MAGFWGRRKRDQEELEAQDADLARRARTALVAADERIRVTTDELAFAEAELGVEPTKDLRDALDSVRTHLGEAFHLHQLNHDEIPDTPEELRTRNARIVQLCEWAEDLLDDRTAGSGRVHRARSSRTRDHRRRAGGMPRAARTRLPQARETVQRLARALLPPEALAQVASNPAEAEQLLGFAEHSASVAERRREAGQREQANLALEAATEAARRAATLIDAVETFEVEALRAESTLSAIVEDSREDLVAGPQGAALPRGRTPRSRELQAALAALPAAGVNTDPFTLLSRLRDANSGLDAAIAAARERAAPPDLAARARAPRDRRRRPAARGRARRHRRAPRLDRRRRAHPSRRGRAHPRRIWTGTSARRHRPRSRSTRTSASRPWRWRDAWRSSPGEGSAARPARHRLLPPARRPGPVGRRPDAGLGRRTAAAAAGPTSWAASSAAS